MSLATAERVPMFASFSLYNYRLFWSGGFVSNVGTWMARVAQDWLVLTILTDNSSLALGIVTGLQFLPTAVLAPWAGSVADRFDKRRVLLLTQAAMTVTGLVLAVLVFTDQVTLWQVYLLATLQGAAAAFDGPARQAFAPEMVPRHLIANSVGLNTTSFHAARLIGPAVAGLTIAWWGVSLALLLNALSFVAVIVALLLMRVGELTPAPVVRARGAVREGLVYIRRRPEIMVVLFVVFMLGTFGLNFQLTNSLMATAVFKVGPEEFGLMGSIMAIGSLAAGLVAARRTTLRLRLILSALAGFTLATAVLSLAPTYLSYVVLLMPTGFLALTVMTASNASVQLAVEPEMRGRVMAIYSAVFLGGTPLGSPLLGWVGEAWGPRWTIAIGSIACGVAVAVAGLYLLRRNHWEWPRLRTPDDPELELVEEPR
ncbi:MAG: MFS transporter [Propionibacteriaceae bacterium]|nr:MFS transporter [Propionibacteriaceae bacterium]